MVKHHTYSETAKIEPNKPEFTYVKKYLRIKKVNQNLLNLYYPLGLLHSIKWIVVSNATFNYISRFLHTGYIRSYDKVPMLLLRVKSTYEGTMRIPCSYRTAYSVAPVTIPA